MRILMIAGDFKPLPGGVSEYSHHLMDHLAGKGSQVRVMAPPMEGAEAFDRQASYGVIRCPLLDGCPFFPSKAVRFLGTWRRIHETLHSFKPDLCILNHISNYLFPAYLAAHLTSTPFVVFTYGMELRTGCSWKNVLPLRWVLGHVDGIVSCSEFTRQESERFALGRAASVCVHPGIEQMNSPRPGGGAGETFPGIERFKPFVLTVCRHVRRKGLDKALLAFARVQRGRPGLTYLIGGTGEDTARLKRIVRRLGLEDSVHFLGYLTEGQKHRLMAESEVFLMPSRELPNGDVEGFGIVYQEAALLGTPSIGGGSGGVPESVLHERTGLVADPPDARHIAKCLRSLLGDETLRHTLGRNAQIRACNELSWEKQGEKFRHFLSQVVNTTAVPAASQGQGYLKQ